MYLQHRPGPAIAPYVEMLWCCEGYHVPHRRERVLPNGRFGIIIDLAERPAPPMLFGMRTTYTILDTACIRSVIGVVFRPGGARAFFDAPAGEFQNAGVPLDDLWR